MNKLIVAFVLSLVAFRANARRPLVKDYIDEKRNEEKVIVGGVTAVEGRYPYQVGLTRGDGIVSCGGSLIAPEWVLSAAHCFGFATHVEIGAYILTEESEDIEIIEIEFEAIHPSFSLKTFEYDVMLVKLANASNASIITLDDGSTDLSAGINVTTIGWGVTDLGFLSNILQEVEVPIVEYSECNSLSSYNGAVFESSMICAGTEGKDSCQGDSGGPLIIKGANATSDVQVGIVSWGIGCGLEGLPGVYSLVHDGTDFIEETTTCSYAEGDDASSFEACCSVACVDGFYSCAIEDCNEACLAFSNNDDFDFSSCNIQGDSCWIGDNWCDVSFNNAECNYDGGDCCKDTCTPDAFTGTCADNFFDLCFDPESEFTIPLSQSTIVQTIMRTVSELVSAFLFVLFFVW